MPLANVKKLEAAYLLGIYNRYEVLIDHAHCEKKAAGTAMSLISAYVDRPDLTHQMVIIVNEELGHFEMVLELLQVDCLVVHLVGC